MPIVIGMFFLFPLLLGLVLEYLCCRLPRRRIWRALPPALGILFTVLVGVGRWSLWESEKVSPVTQLLIFPGVPGQPCCWAAGWAGGCGGGFGSPGCWMGLDTVFFHICRGECGKRKERRRKPCICT